MSRRFEIVVSPHMGYCFGVMRAMRLIEQGLESRGGTIYTLGDVIHNPLEVERLRTRGVHPVESLEELPRGGTLVLRAHGVSPDLVEEALARGVRILDATCPFVQLSQRYVKGFAEEAIPVIIIGDREHPEVKGIAGHAGGNAIVVKDAREAEAVGPLDRAGVVIQTTFSRREAEAVIEALRKRVRTLTVRDTICQATEARREAVLDLARNVDSLLVVGGRNSSNTMRLYRSCVQSGVPAHLIESADDIDESWFTEVRKVGVTTGTSTPAWIIDGVLERLERISLQSA
jgi:(E)-4-hydroxy-3-methyl-but-2-enyl pyrophosphate reductase